MELVYTAYVQNSNEIMEFLLSKNSFFIALVALVIFFGFISDKKEIREGIPYKYFSGLVFMFFSLSIFTDYYSLTNKSSSLKRALVNKHSCKYIEGVIQEYTYRSSIKRELFLVNGIRFDVNDNLAPLTKNYPKLISTKQLKVRVEYIAFPKHNTTVVRIWRL